MTRRSAVGRTLEWMPFLFGIGFLAPLAITIFSHIWPAAGARCIWAGLILGGGWGLLTVRRGRWL